MPKLHRIVLAALAAAVWQVPLAAQEAPKMVGVRVSTSAPGGTFWVDGTEYKSMAQFNWVEGSKHLIEMRKTVQLNWLCDTRWRFGGWTVSGEPALNNASPALVYTASAAHAQIEAAFQVQYRLDVSISGEQMDTWQACVDEQDLDNSAPDRPPVPPSIRGFILTEAASFRPQREAQSCLSSSGWGWFSANSRVPLAAAPYPGFAFAGWYGTGIAPGSFIREAVMTGPMQLQANFVEAKRVTFATAPEPGLRVVVDRDIVQTRRPGQDCLLSNRLPGQPAYPPGFTPGEFEACKMIPLCTGDLDLIPGSQHILAAPPSQRDLQGRLWIFDRWELGLGGEPVGQNAVVTIPSDNRPYTFTAHFVPGTLVTLNTEPANLKLVVDGRDNVQNNYFEWGAGHTHSIDAPWEQVDAKGRKWRFVRWSNGGPAFQEITIPPDHDGETLRLTAEYELLGQLTLRSEPSNLTLSVNGEECVTPCVIDRPAGTEALITALPERTISEDTRIEFSGWGDSEEAARAYTFTHDAVTMTARYQHLHRLTLLSDPEEGARFKLNPAAGPGGFFTAGVRVQLEVESNPGFKFRRLEGALSGTVPMGSLTMNRPYTVAARFDRVPDLPEGAVQNAAGETPEKAVAPGSLIAVRGKHLAPHFESGYFNPLKQTLLGVTVHVGDRILPLIHVSPDEIIAQLPSTVPPGEHKLTVKQMNQPPVTSDFTVVPAAPGLFTQPQKELPYAEIYHADGRPVTPEDPAKPGMTLLLTGTGFGPTSPPWLDGFLTPESPALPLRDAIELFVEGEPHPYLWVGAQPNRVGRNLVRFVLGAARPAGGGESQNLRIQVKVQGRASNTVLLPVAAAQ